MPQEENKTPEKEAKNGKLKERLNSFVEKAFEMAFSGSSCS
jgi:hypothetical protein